MDNTYCVYYEDQDCGTLHVEQAGLYLQFSGRFILEQGKIWRIIGRCGDKQADLGICLFEEPYYLLKKKCPKKQFTDGHWVFEAVCPSDIRKKSVSVSQDQPFEHLDQLEDALLLTDGQVQQIVLNADH